MAHSKCARTWRAVSLPVEAEALRACEGLWARQVSARAVRLALEASVVGQRLERWAASLLRAEPRQVEQAQLVPALAAFALAQGRAFSL